MAEKKQKIIFTGGGSGGHVTLNLNLIPLFLQNGWEVVYIGSHTGIERELIGRLENVRYYAIATGKLRRYFSWNNFKDALRVPLGVIEAYFIIRKECPDIIFSKGGFVSFPVVAGGWLNRCKKIFMHESDVTPGLSNKMSLPFVSTFFTTFADTVKYVRPNWQKKVKYIGPVLSDRLENGNPDAARTFCDFTQNKPTLLFVGGSLGAKSINAAVRQNLDTLLESYNVIHICGKGQTDALKRAGYAQFEFVDKEFKDLLALADVVISRSGSNAIFELLSQKKAMLLVPLPSNASRGEQALNAQSFQQHGYAEIINDADLADSAKFIGQINNTYQHRAEMVQNMQNSALKQTGNRQLFEEIING